MGLADEIQKEIAQTAERNPLLLNIRLGSEELGRIHTETPEGVRDHLAFIHKLLLTHIEVTEAHRKAILRLAREIDDLHALLGGRDDEDK